MRIIVVIILLSGLSSGVFAQSRAADRDAIDFTGRMDTIARGQSGSNWSSELIGCLNLGLQNSDNWEDFEIIYGPQTNYGKMRFGGPLIYDTINNPSIQYTPVLYEDVDDDGKGDLLANDYFWYRGKKEFPYFDDTVTSILHYDAFPSTHTIGGIDYDQDGFKDILVAADNGKFSIRLYKGAHDFGKQGTVFPSDSILISPHSTIWKGFTVASFGKNLPPMIVFGIADSNKYKIGLIRNSVPLHEDTVIWISNTDIKGIVVQNLFATDITGDGITDLLVSDGLHIYIFKGGDNFGTYPLTKENAFYIIPSPGLLGDDVSHDFGTHIYACGNLTGSGIPYIAADGNLDRTESSLFFYAGGKALDSLYDAVVTPTCTRGLGLDTLHSINSTGRTVALIDDYSDESFNYNDIIFLLSRDCEKIPHKTNPEMLSVHKRLEYFNSTILKIESGGGFIRFKISGENLGNCVLTIYDLLGRELVSRNLTIYGNDIEQFNTSDFPDGIYFGVLRGNGIECSAKFPVSRAMKEQAPESPVILQMNETIPGILR